MFEKKTWVNRQSEHPARRRLTPTGNDNEFDVARAEGVIMEDGDAFDAETMNDLEKRVAEGFSTLDPADLGVNVCVQVYACVKSGTVYELTGSGAVGRCKIPAAWNSGDTWSVNGKAVPAYCGADTVDSDLSDVLSGKKFYAGNKNLKTGTLALSGNANAAQVLSGYTFYKDNAKSKQTGSMANRGSISTTLNPGGSKSYSAGYYSGGTINCNSATSVIKTTTLNISGTWSQNTASASAPGTIVGIKSMWRNGDSSSPRSISTSGSTLSVEWDSYNGSLSLSFTVAYI